MSTDPTQFINAVDKEPSFDGGVKALTFGIAEEIEARISHRDSLIELAERIRIDTPRIVDALLSNIVADERTSQKISSDEQETEPVDGFFEAVEFVVGRGYDQSEARQAVIREGVTTILTAKAKLAKSLDAGTVAKVERELSRGVSNARGKAGSGG